MPPFDPATEPRSRHEVADEPSGERHPDPTPRADTVDPENRPFSLRERGQDIPEDTSAGAMLDDEGGQVDVTLDVDEVLDKLGALGTLGGLL